MPEAHEGNEKVEQQTESIRIYEKFADSEQYNDAIDTNIWSNTDSDANHTSVVVTASERLEQDGDTTAGSTYIRTNRKFSRNVVIEADLITTTLTEGASAGEVYPSIRLYTSATEWVRWGPYKENGGQDSIGFIQFSDKGDVDQEVDVNAANTDAIKRKYTIMVLEDKLVFLINGVYQFEMSMVGLHDFYVDLITSTTQADNAYVDIFWSEAKVKNIDQASLDTVEKKVTEVLHSKPQGDVFYVNSALGSDTDEGSFEHPKATVDGGVNACAPSHGDVVVVINAGAVYDENAAVTGVTMDTAGVTLIGIDEPVLANSNGAATAVITITAAYCSVIGINITEVTLTVSGIYINGVDYCVIRDCIIWGDMLYGVYINNGDWNLVYKNHIAEQGTLNHAGIRIDGSSRSNRIIKNWCDNTDKGIWLEAGTQTQNLLLSNIIGGSGAGTSIGIYINGAGANHTEVKDNWITDCVAVITDTGTSSDFADNHEDYANFNNNVLYTDEDRWEVLTTLWAADGANVFNPTVQGVAQTDLELAIFNLAAYFAAGGAAISSTIDPGGTARVDLETLWEDLGMMLAGANGITTWPVGVAPGDGVSFAEAIREIYNIADNTYNQVNALQTHQETGGTFTTDGAENTVYIEDAPLGIFKARMFLLDVDTMVGGDTLVIRVYYRLKSGGALKLHSYTSYTGIDGGLGNSRKLDDIVLLDNRFGVKITEELTAGANHDYDWEVTEEA